MYLFNNKGIKPNLCFWDFIFNFEHIQLTRPWNKNIRGITIFLLSRF